MTWLRFGLLVMVLAGCGGEPSEPTAPMPVALRTQPPPAGGEACMGALLTGTLTTSGLSGIAIVDSEGGIHEIAWPFGYSGRIHAGGLDLLDASGTVVASSRDTVEIGGGEGNDGTWFACGGITADPTG